MQAYWEAEHDAGEKAKVKRQERVIKRWTRLIQGLRLRQRLQEQYAERPEPSVSENVTDENRVPEVEEVGRRNVLVQSWFIMLSTQYYRYLWRVGT